MKTFSRLAKFSSIFYFRSQNMQQKIVGPKRKLVVWWNRWFSFSVSKIKTVRITTSWMKWAIKRQIRSNSPKLVLFSSNHSKQTSRCIAGTQLKTSVWKNSVSLFTVCKYQVIWGPTCGNIWLLRRQTS